MEDQSFHPYIPADRVAPENDGRFRLIGGRACDCLWRG